jgi:hypothetical protein
MWLLIICNYIWTFLQLLYYLSDFGTNYILIFKFFFKECFFLKQNEKSFEIFWKYFDFKMKSLNLINW